MNHSRLERYGYATTAIAGVVMVVAAVGDWTRFGLAAAGVAVCALALALYATSQTARRQATTRQFDKQLKSIQRDSRAIQGQLRTISTAIDMAPSQVVELHRKYEQLVTATSAMPAFGGWAAPAATVVAILDEVIRNPRRQVVLECGSGASTVWVAAALARRGSGHVYALEHDRDFAAVTRAQLEDQGLSEWGTVIDAPLTDVSIDDTSQPWYDLADLPPLEGIDLLFVDGPPGNIAPLARYPAFPLLRAHLDEGAWVVLDDTGRKAEQQIVDTWTTDSGAGLTLRVDRVIGRSTFMSVCRA